ncbi:hypothetical protein ABIB25_000376 [Nakamurella sp. UYEF19]|uniref:DUF3145 domain-containing protein n=1 Tax=Nakamurella sp. UYEF19 TaxID=1756392 RepID=UPI003394E9DE
MNRDNEAPRATRAQGVIFVHSAPAAICPHVEWAISGVVGDRVSLSWTAQPASPGQLRAEVGWKGTPGTAGRIASALRAWPMLRFEITEDASHISDGERLCHVPGRGLWRSAMAANGDLVLGEDRIRSLMERATSLDGLRHALSEALGAEVDAELESFRRAGEGTPVTWLHQVG